MSDSATRKINRARRHIAEAEGLVSEARPFSYIVETDTRTGLRACFAQQNPAAIERLADVYADALHNLRVALDHAYWHVVSPHALDAARKIQFPFSATAADLSRAVINAQARRVSEKFFHAIMDLKPYGEAGGHTLLYAIHQLDITDKHRTPIPTAHYTNVTSAAFQAQIPDFPSGLVRSLFSGNHRDAVWRAQLPIPAELLGIATPEDSQIFRREVNLPVEIALTMDYATFGHPVIPTLQTLVDVTEAAIEVVISAAR